MMEYRTFLFTYNFDGAKWELPIKAKTPEEARARLNNALYAEYSGELMASFPATPTIFSRFANFCMRLLRSGQ
ncbi:MAG: hypothetical protein AB7P24_10855 [Nitrospira sp.]